MTRRRILTRDPALVLSVSILTALLVVSIGAGWLAPADPLLQRDVLTTRFLPPLVADPSGVMHWLGTDRFGRDVLSRLMYGSRISLTVGFVSVTLSLGLGLLMGVTAATVGGRIEHALMGITDAALAMPRLVLLLALVALFEPSLALVIIVLGCTGWMTIARLARADVKSVLQQPYVQAARSGGVPTWLVLARHILPNAATSVIVASALAVGNAIALESGLAFLGLGVPPPAPSWGNMIAEGREALVNAPWIAVFPGLAIVLVVVSTNLLGDGIRDALDPTVRHRHTSTVTTSRGPASNETRVAPSSS
jgi:peptide/nickel transport system permease protein